MQNILIQEAQSRCQSQQPTPQEAQQAGGPEKPDLYAQNYFYDQTNSSLNNTALRNGNISGTTWISASQCQRHGFAYTYDTDNRLTNSTHKDLITNASNNFSETFAYTRNGNISNLQRRGVTNPAATNPTFGLIDNLTYTYNTQSNQTRKIEDAITSNTQGFINRNIAGTGNDFDYDANGNIIRDRDKKISTSGTGLTISYNYLNLPNVMSNGGKKVVNLYDALGNKLMTRFGDDALPTAFTNTPPAHRFYLNQTQYYNAGTYPYTPAERESVYHAEGRLHYATNNGNGTPTYEYTLRDHLGNLRVQFSNITDPNTGYPIILQENHYYAYGSAIPSLSTSTANAAERYTYNGKELIEDFNINLLDYGARLYDPLTARWNGVDPLAEQYHTTTGYGYVSGNPISKIDIDGLGEYYTNDGRYLGHDEKKDDLVYISTEGNYHYSTRVGKKPNYNALRANSTLLDIEHTKFQTMANIIRQEGASSNPDEYLYIAHANNNMAISLSESMYDLLMSGYSSVRDKSALSTNNNSAKASYARSGLIDVLLGGDDPTNGATLWDGEDFLAWGLISCDGTPQNKFEEYNNIQIPCNLYNKYLVNIQTKYGSCMKFRRPPCNGSWFEIPSEVFNTPNNWDNDGFNYDTNAEVPNRIKATAVVGTTIFWQTIKAK